MIIWLTGLPCSGKTTIAYALAARLRQECLQVEVLDGDDIRPRFWSELGFSRQERDINVLRFAALACMFSNHGIIAIVSVVSPHRATRDAIHKIAADFLEVYVNASLEVCEARDVKGMYKRARAGEIKNFTGLDGSYEKPLNPDVECATDRETVEECVIKILAKIQEKQQ